MGNATPSHWTLSPRHRILSPMSGQILPTGMYGMGLGDISLRVFEVASGYSDAFNTGWVNGATEKAADGELMDQCYGLIQGIRTGNGAAPFSWGHWRNSAAAAFERWSVNNSSLMYPDMAWTDGGYGDYWADVCPPYGGSYSDTSSYAGWVGIAGKWDDDDGGPNFAASCRFNMWKTSVSSTTASTLPTKYGLFYKVAVASGPILYDDWDRNWSLQIGYSDTEYSCVDAFSTGGITWVDDVVEYNTIKAHCDAGSYRVFLPICDPDHMITLDHTIYLYFRTSGFAAPPDCPPADNYWRYEGVRINGVDSNLYAYVQNIDDIGATA